MSNAGGAALMLSEKFMRRHPPGNMSEFFCPWIMQILVCQPFAMRSY